MVVPARPLHQCLGVRWMLGIVVRLAQQQNRLDRIIGLRGVELPRQIGVDFRFLHMPPLLTSAREGGQRRQRIDQPIAVALWVFAFELDARLANGQFDLIDGCVGLGLP